MFVFFKRFSFLLNFLGGFFIYYLFRCFCFLWKDSYAYNKGKIFVVSKVFLLNYRADLDERYGFT